MDDLRQRIQDALSTTYEIERELGGGGMSRTYLARERSFDRRVVVKVLAPELLMGLSVERFRREVLLAAQLQHPHVVPVLAAGDVNGLPWFTMPYVDGDSLRQRLAAGPVSITEAVGILRDVARALAYAHSHGVIHRDIKPDNVLLSAGSATVTDFGIAKAINAARTGPEGTNAALTMTGMSIGTPTYMSPEQAAGDPNADARSDLYAFGAMAYELLAGRPPFHGLTPAKLLAAHMGERPKDVRTLRPDCPDALAELVMQCLEKDVEARPAAASDLARVLDTITSSGARAAAPSILAGGRIGLSKAITLWALATAGVAITAWAARSAIGLPDWTLFGAVGVMLLGLPVILATWYAQHTVHNTYVGTPGGTTTGGPHSTMATLALKASPHLSWRRTWLGGSIAVGGFGALIVAWMVMRALGIGPFGSLQGRGTFGERETIVVADFASPEGDSALGPIVAEALRTDLAQSKSLEILTRAQTREALVRMRRAEDASLPFDVARELATREGAKAVLDGAIVRLGKSFVITARLISAADGEELVQFREEAPNEDALLTALGRLSRAVRERAGESLRSIRETDELNRVTTASLPALRKYVEGIHIADELGDNVRGIELLKQAVELDTAFAMAWRKISTMLENEGLDPVGAMRATEAAYRHRDRLTEYERYLTEARYFTNGPQPDLRKAIEAYEASLRLPGGGLIALNNLALLYAQMREYEKSEAALRQSVASNTRFATAFLNLMGAQAFNGRISAMDSTRQRLREVHPTFAGLWTADMLLARANEQWNDVARISEDAYRASRTASQRSVAASSTADAKYWTGQPSAGLSWTQRSREETQTLTTSSAARLGASLDSAATIGLLLRRPAEARALVRRALAAYPIEAMEPLERPSLLLLSLAAALGDKDVARIAVENGRTTQFTIGPDSVGVRAYISGLTAYANEDFVKAASEFRVADRRMMVDELQGGFWLALSYDQAGMSDSALVSMERFTSRMEPVPVIQSRTLVPMLRRQGELYEARGDKAKAIAAYQRVVDLWKNGEPEFQAQARDVQARIDKLRPPG
jgi:tetratricopeptide (TPR) repeat protein